MSLRVPLPVALAPVAVAVALAVVLAAGPSHASPRRTCALRPITARTTIPQLARHFGRATFSRFRAGAQTDAWIARERNWTVIRYIHPQPRPTP